MDTIDAVSPSRALLDRVRALAQTAGTAILEIYAREDFGAARKSDGSPVTLADAAAERIILDGLATLTPGVPVIAEEAHSAGHVPDVSGGRFWLVDPLDGTREFLNRNGEFTVNIALVEGGQPVLGVVHAPALGLTYAGSLANGAEISDGDDPPRRIAARTVPAEGVTVVCSRRHGDPEKLARFLGGRKVAAERQIGSSLKLCLVAAGEADLYPRYGRTMEWDTAAGQAVVAAAGGIVTDTDGAPLVYGKPGFENPEFIVWGKRR
ncbi:MAG TPA: 3'(2'),5'-bisphosphate nucleotidase CysQ [Alphaproteobacteria bacterium]|nr:3'(2'),5'-bisphosphate nucleotidase CysQ [Alphaproteobacteria bacterium]